MRRLWLLILLATLLPGTAGATDPTDRDGDGEPGEAWAIRQRIRTYLERHGRDGRLTARDQLARSRWGYERFTEAGRDRRAKGIEGPGWISLGPVNAAGRVAAVAPHPDWPGVVLAGAAGGGVWRTDDDGATWRPLTDGLPDLSVGAVAWAPSDPDIVYVGTGEAGFAVDFIPGIGLLRSDDGGETWLLPDEVVASQFYALSVDPRDADRLVAATNDGLFTTDDGGVSWHLRLASSDLMGVTEVLRSPADPDRLWTAVWCTSRCPEGIDRVMRSDDGGVTWTSAAAGLAGTVVLEPVLNRLALTVAPSNPDVLYAAVNTGEREERGPVVAIFRSDDGGDSWRRVPADPGPYLGMQGWYDNALTVHPLDPDHVVGSGIWYVVTTDGGITWTEVNPYAVGDGMGGDGVPHVDGHDLQWQGDRLWLGCDGGVWVSDDGGLVWRPRNTGLVTRQYYGIALDPIRRDRVLGGTQDNGSDLRVDATDDGWVDVLGADGFECQINPLLPDVMYGSVYATWILRATDGGLGEWQDVSPPNAGEASPFLTPLTMHPERPWELLTGRELVYRTRDAGDRWTALRTEVLGGGSWSSLPVTAVAVTPAADGVVMAAKGDRVYSSDDDGRTWWMSVFDGSVNHVELSPFDADIGLASLALTDDGAGGLQRTTDGGVTWHDASDGLPPFAVQVTRFDPTDPAVVYAGTDVGLYRSTDAGLQWQRYGDGLPAASVHDIRILPDGSMLRVGTHGRGVWELHIPQADNRPPTVSVAQPRGATITVPVGDPVAFEATAADPDGDPVELTWMFGGLWRAQSTGPADGPLTASTSQRFERAGTWPVGVHVADARGAATFTRIDVVSVEPGDDCASPRATSLDGPLPFEVVSENLSTGEQASDPEVPCAGLALDPLSGRYGSIWFEITPAVSGRYRLTTCGSTADTVLSLWTGPACGPYTAVAGACNDDDAFRTCASDRTASTLDLELETGVTYRAMVGAWDDDRRGTVRFTVDCLDCPPQQPATAWTVPGAAHATGLAGTVWRTDLDLANPGAAAVRAEVAWLPDADGLPATVTVDVAPGATVRVPDVVEALFSRRGPGGIGVAADGELVVSTRTFNDASGGTYGQGIPGLRDGDTVPPGGVARFVGVAETDRTRTNLGLVNPGPTAVRARVDLEDRRGDRLLRFDVDLPPRGWRQLDQVFAAERVAPVEIGRILVRNMSADRPLATYASVIDQATGDPSYLGPARIARTGDVLWIAAATHTDGLAGTTWRTDLMFASIEPVYAEVRLSFHPPDGVPVETTVIVPQEHTVRYEDVVADLFGSDGGGAVRLEVMRGYLGVSSRTYTTAAAGTYGQAIPAVHEDDAFTDHDRVWVPGVRQGRGDRTNFGMVNVTDGPIELEASALDVDGRVLAVRRWTVPGGGWLQATRPFPAATVGAQVVALTPGARFFVYASAVDGGTGDPTYLAGVRVDR